MEQVPSSLLLLVVAATVFHYQGLVSATGTPLCKIYNSTYADCTWRNLKQVPDTLPPTTTDLDLSYNNIQSFPDGCFRKYRKLQVLNMDHISPINFGPRSLIGLVSLKVLALTHCRKLTVDGQAFRHLTSLIHLTISTDNLNTLHMSETAGMFSNLKHLSYLKIHVRPTNITYRLPSAIFKGLYNLKELSVNTWRIANFSSSTFEDMKKLKIITLDISYLKCMPIAQLMPLQNLQAITIMNMAMKPNFGEDVDFTHFPSLQKLDIIITNINCSDEFSVPKFNLQLNLSEFNFVCYCQSKTPIFRELTEKLTFLTVQRVSLDIRTDEKMLKNILYRLKNPKLTSLNIAPDSRIPLNNIKQDTFKGLHGSELQELEIYGSELTTVPMTAFQWLPHLKILNLEFNKLDDLQPGTFQNLTKLETLILTGNKFIDLQKVIKALDVTSEHLQYLHINRNKLYGTVPSKIFLQFKSLIQLNLAKNQINVIYNDSFDGLMNLEILDLSDNQIERIPHASFSEMRYLRTLHLNDNPLTDQDMDMTTHPFYNLHNLTEISIDARINSLYLEDATSLKKFYLNRKGRELDSLPCTFNITRPITSLTEVTMQNIIMPPDYSSDCITNYLVSFITKHSLVKLTLSSNNFDHIDFTNLNNFVNLRELSLADNKITTFYGKPDKLKKLEYLDLSNNRIASFTLDFLTSLPSLRQLGIHGNPFDCSCMLKELHDWLETDTKVQVLTNYDLDHNNVCGYPKKTDKMSIFEISLGLECNLAFMISVPIAGVVLTVAVCIALVFRFNWYFRYAIFMIKLKRGGYHRHANEEEEPLNRKYDAFVVYNQHNRPWVMQQLIPNLENIDPPNFKLCIHDRDFIPGVDIFDNILDSIENSHKTMLIVSPHFAESEWCYFEMRMAQDHLFTAKKDVIMLVLLEDIPDELMPRVLRKILRTKNYIKWTDNAVGRQLFWAKLKAELESHNMVNRVANV